MLLSAAILWGKSQEIRDLNHNFAKRQAYDSSNSSISRVNYPRYTLGVSK